MDDPNLQRLARELRKETCHPVVMDRLKDQLAGTIRPRCRPGAPTGRALTERFRFAWSIVAILLLAAAIAWHLRISNPLAPAAEIKIAAQTAPNPELIAQQTGQAFAVVSYSLRTALLKSENAFFEHAVPPLRNGIESVKSKINEK
jgi:hypothetical protein